MSYIFGDSFDLYGGGGDGAYYWDAFSITTLGPGRFPGGQAVGISMFSNLTKVANGSYKVHKFNLAMKVEASMFGPTGNGLSFYLYDGSAVQVSFAFAYNGDFYVWGGAFGGSTPLIGHWVKAYSYPDQWYSFEVEVVIDAVNGSVTVRRENSSTNDFQITGVNTQNGSANASADRIHISQPQAVFLQQALDDILWRADNTAPPWLGDVRTYIRLPNSDVSKQFTPTPSVPNNYQNVSELHDDKLTTYVSDNVVGHGDMYTVSGIPVVPNNVVAVTSRMYCQKSDTGSRQGVMQLKSGTTLVQSATDPLILHTFWGWVWRMDTVDPNTGTDWTNAAVDALQVGPYITA